MIIVIWNIIYFVNILQYVMIIIIIHLFLAYITPCIQTRTLIWSTLLRILIFNCINKKRLAAYYWVFIGAYDVNILINFMSLDSFVRYSVYTIIMLV